jgi:hypothetical protein
MGEKEFAALGESLRMGPDGSQVAECAPGGAQEGMLNPLVYFPHDVECAGQEEVIVLVNAPCE